jgi:hypothetical protein
VVFHEMLTGSRPFLADSTAELISAILRDPPPRLVESRYSLPSGLEEAVNRCLEKQPHYRFQSAEELAESVDEAVAGHAASSSREVREARDGEPRLRSVRRSRWPVVTGLALALAVAASLAVRLDPGSERALAPPPIDLSLGLLPLEEIGEPADPELAAELANELREALGAVGNLELVEGFLPSGSDGATARADADYVLAGVLEWSGPPSGRQAQLSFELSRGADGVAIWSESLGRPELGTHTDRNAVASAVRARIGDLLGLPTPPAPRLSQAPAPDPSPDGVANRPPQEARGPPLASAAVEEKPGIAASESSPAGEPAAVRPADRAELAIHVVSSLPAGVVTVYADGERVYERAFEFTERKGGVLGRVGLKRKVAGELSDGMLVPAAVTELRIYVTLPGEPARHVALTQRLRADGTDRLVIDIRKKHAIEVRLE